MAIWLEEEWVNETKGYRCGSSGIYESFTDNVGVLFRELQKEYGRCISKVYIDTKTGVRPVGWVFQRRETYQILNCWVVLYTEPEKVVRTRKHFVLA